MTFRPVEWVLAIFYGPSAHRATYGRLNNTKYTKDFIQLSKKEEFVDTVARLFSVSAEDSPTVSLKFKWPEGSAPGEFVFISADRPHLKWDTHRGAPSVWRMTPSPTKETSETIPGDPNKTELEDAEREYEQIQARGGGQPYLLAVKLRDEPRTLHLRAYLKNPDPEFMWADFALLPPEIQAIAERTSQNSALGWSLIQSGGSIPSPDTQDLLQNLASSGDLTTFVNALNETSARQLMAYLRSPGHGIFFDPERNHDAWREAAPLPPTFSPEIDTLLARLEGRFPVLDLTDASAEELEPDPAEVDTYQQKIDQESYEVLDAVATVKTRGSAQRAFADVVKANYQSRCAVTGITTRQFLVASHIVPWSVDQSIRLDPANGICLSVLIDLAFEKGYLTIDDDLTVRVDWGRVGDDDALRSQLEPFDGQAVESPVRHAPKIEYIRKRRELVGLT